MNLEFKEKDLEAVAQKLLIEGKDCRIWFFFGDIGSGKTTLIKNICGKLGVKAGASSPTFSIINEYRGLESKIYHMDFYRIKNEKEVLDLGVEEYFESGNYCFVEWPEKLGSWRPARYFEVKLAISREDSRNLEYQSYG